MHRLEQSGDEGDPITLNFNLGCELEEAIYSIGTLTSKLLRFFGYIYTHIHTPVHAYTHMFVLYIFIL